MSEPCTLNNRFVLSLNDGITSVPTIETKTQQAAQQIYDLQGRRVNTPGKGLYIKNGIWECQNSRTVTGPAVLVSGYIGDGPFVSVPLFHFYLVLIVQQIFFIF